MRRPAGLLYVYEVTVRDIRPDGHEELTVRMAGHDAAEARHRADHLSVTGWMVRGIKVRGVMASVRARRLGLVGKV